MLSNILRLRAMRSMLACGVAITAAAACNPSASVPSIKAGASPCKFQASSEWLATGVVWEVSANGRSIVGAGPSVCGFTFSFTSPIVPVSVELKAPCKNVGYFNPNLIDVGKCNDLGASTDPPNRVRMWDARSGLPIESTYASVNLPYQWVRGQPPDTTTAIALKNFNHPSPGLRGAATKDTLLVSFQHGNHVAWARAEITGHRVAELAQIAGPDEATIGVPVSWQGQVSGFHPAAFRYTWRLNGQTLPAGTNSQYVGGFATPGPHTLSADIRMDDGSIKTASKSVMPRLGAVVSGPTQINAAGSYTWSVWTGAETYAPSQSWTYFDGATGQSTSLGSGQQITLYVDETSPPIFQLEAAVSASGFLGNSSGVYQVWNTISGNGGNCGGYACLKADTGRRFAPPRVVPRGTTPVPSRRAN